MWQDFDFNDFWRQSDYAKKEYQGDSFSAEDVTRVEKELGYRLPEAYLAFMAYQNGGIPTRDTHATAEATSWSEDCVAINGFLSIGGDKRNSLLGEFGSQFWLEEWGYPNLGIAICDCPSAGHDMIFLDYRQSGPTGEPTVVHIDQELDYRITQVADNFEGFIKGLYVDEEEA